MIEFTSEKMAEKMRDTTLLVAKSKTFFRRFGFSYNVLQYGDGGAFPNAVAHTLSFHFLTKPRQYPR